VIDDRVCHEGPAGTGWREVEVGPKPSKVNCFVSCWDVQEANASLFF